MHLTYLSNFLLHSKDMEKNLHKCFCKFLKRNRIPYHFDTNLQFKEFSLTEDLKVDGFFLGFL